MSTNKKDIKIYGIDHGTTHCAQVVAEIDEKFNVKFEIIKDLAGNSLTPSIIFDDSLLHQTENKTKINKTKNIIYGFAAKLKKIDFPEGALFHIKRFMGEKYVIIFQF